MCRVQGSYARSQHRILPHGATVKYRVLMEWCAHAFVRFWKVGFEVGVKVEGNTVQNLYPQSRVVFSGVGIGLYGAKECC